MSRIVLAWTSAFVLLFVNVQARYRTFSRFEAFGDIGDLHPTGASQETADGDHLSYHGVRASDTMAETDLTSMNLYKNRIFQAALIKNFDPAVIAGIISRESRAGKALKDGWGDHGNAFGLMQIDKRYHQPLLGKWNSVEHILQGTGILIDMIRKVQRKFPNWTLAQQLQGGIAAYNFGVNNVQSWEHLDVGTTHGDYSNDVVARAQYYRRQGYRKLGALTPQVTSELLERMISM